jgi:hypothetical protein
MTDPLPPPPDSAVTRLKDRLLHPWSRAKDEASLSNLPAVTPPRPVGFPSSIAEFLLVFRLRARRRSALSGDMMERALHMVLVTCKNWFSSARSHHSRPQKRD